MLDNQNRTPSVARRHIFPIFSACIEATGVFLSGLNRVERGGGWASGHRSIQTTNLVVPQSKFDM